MRLVAVVNEILFSETLAAEGAIVFAKACELTCATPEPLSATSPDKPGSDRAASGNG
jgi:hypothetical protein